MVTNSSDWFLKDISKGENSHSVIYNYQSGEPIRVPTTDVNTYLSKKTKSIKMVDGVAQEYGEVFNPFVINKEKCIGSVASDNTAMVAPSSKVKGKRRKRGKRGKRK